MIQSLIQVSIWFLNSPLNSGSLIIYAKLLDNKMFFLLSQSHFIESGKRHWFQLRQNDIEGNF